VLTILFGWLGYHYFKWRRPVSGVAMLCFSLLLLIGGGLGILITFALGVYDGVRYLTMTEAEFAECARRRDKSTAPMWHTWALLAFLAGWVLFLVVLYFRLR
jgi:hypothetical protein